MLDALAKRWTRLSGAAVVLAVVALGPWTEGSASTPSGTDNDGKAMNADINIPLDGIQEGQYCQAYGLAYNYTGSLGDLVFDWGLSGGQLNNSHAWDGPLGERQIAGKNFYASGGQTLSLRVIDTFPDTAFASVSNLNISSGNEFNDECGA